MKSLLLATTAVLAFSSGLAHAASPSASLTIDVTPAHAPAVPPLAAAAGFTTLALNSDFTTMSLSDIGCAIDGSSTGSSGWGYSGAPLPTNPNAGCGAGGGIYFGTDQGSQALFVHWQPSFDNNGPNWCSTTALTCNIGITTKNGALFPLNSYIEITARWNIASPGSGEQWAFWSWPTVATTWFERDFIEQFGAGTLLDFDNIHWYNGGTTWSGNHYAADSSVYHTYGYLDVGNSAQTQITFTGYLDNTVISNGNGCNPCTVGLDSNTVNQTNNFLIIQQIPQAYPGNYTGDVIVKNVRVWTCANWRTTNCFPGQ